MSDTTIHELWDEMIRRYALLDEIGAAERERNEVLSMISSLSDRVRSEGVISSNDELIDVDTRDLPLLSLAYYSGKCFSKETDIDRRLVALQIASKKYIQFLQTLQNFHMLTGEEEIIFDSFDDEVFNT